MRLQCVPPAHRPPPLCRTSNELQAQLEQRATTDEKRELLSLQYRVGVLELENMQLEHSRLLHSHTLQAKSAALRQLRLRLRARDRVIEQLTQAMISNGLGHLVDVTAMQVLDAELGAGGSEEEDEEDEGGNLDGEGGPWGTGHGGSKYDDDDDEDDDGDVAPIGKALPRRYSKLGGATTDGDKPSAPFSPPIQLPSFPDVAFKQLLAPLGGRSRQPTSGRPSPLEVKSDAMSIGSSARRHDGRDSPAASMVSEGMGARDRRWAQPRGGAGAAAVGGGKPAWGGGKRVSPLSHAGSKVGGGAASSARSPTDLRSESVLSEATVDARDGGRRGSGGAAVGGLQARARRASEEHKSISPTLGQAGMQVLGGGARRGQEEPEADGPTARRQLAPVAASARERHEAERQRVRDRLRARRAASHGKGGEGGSSPQPPPPPGDGYDSPDEGQVGRAGRVRPHSPIVSPGTSAQSSPAAKADAGIAHGRRAGGLGAGLARQGLPAQGMFSNPGSNARKGDKGGNGGGRVIPPSSGMAGAVYGSVPFAMPAQRSKVGAFGSVPQQPRKPLSGQPQRSGKPLSGQPTSSSGTGSHSLSSQYHARKYKEQQQRLRARRGQLG